MTERLYYNDPALAQFEARVTRVDFFEGRQYVRLDRTAFYPTSGGQPFDTGTLGGAPVIDVVDDEDGEVRHVVEGTLTEGASVASTKRIVTGRSSHTIRLASSSALPISCGVTSRARSIVAASAPR